MDYAERLIEQYDVRSGQGPITIARSMSGGNQQKAIIAREVDKDPDLLVAVQPTRGLDVGAIEYIHKQIVAERDKGKAVLLVSLELDEVMNLSDRILVMYEGEIVGEFDPKTTTVAGARACTWQALKRKGRRKHELKNPNSRFCRTPAWSGCSGKLAVHRRRPGAGLYPAGGAEPRRMRWKA